MDIKAKREIAAAIIAANKWASEHEIADTAGAIAAEALKATCDDKDLRELLTLVLWWPADAGEWAWKIMRQ